MDSRAKDMDEEMIFKKNEEQKIDIDAEEERAKDMRILNDCKTMKAQIESDIMLLNNTIRQLEEKYGISDSDD